jgi:membrane-anchored glycerophosphoryl diester phosphodiesterase (GDPDase)
MFMGHGIPTAVTVLSLMVGVLFLVFLKYALADPLVVTKNSRARESLRISWHMTRGHFGYVLLCYLLLGGVLVVVGYFTPEFGAQGTFGMLADVVLQYFNGVLGTIWIVLAWVMYVRIKAADEEPNTLTSLELPAA